MWPEDFSCADLCSAGADPENSDLFFHGGGFTIGSTEDHFDLCGKIAHAAAAKVISVDYRLAPEHPFPAAVEDCFGLTKWILDHGVHKIIPQQADGVRLMLLLLTICQQVLIL